MQRDRLEPSAVARAHEAQAPTSKAVTHRIGLGILSEPFACVLMDGLEHEQAVAASHEQLFVDQRAQGVK
jgi:hypothetical protein